MKNLLKALCALLLVTMSVTATAAEKSKKQITTCEYSVDIDCEGCVKKVMNTIPFQKGIKSVDVDLKSKCATISYDAAKCTNEAIVTAFKKIDIKAKIKTRNEATCEMKCCPK